MLRRGGFGQAPDGSGAAGWLAPGMLAPLLVMLTLGQVDLNAMSHRGPLVLVEESKAGRFGQATGVVFVEAGADKVWAALLAMEHFKEFVPKVITSDVTRRGEKDFDIHFTIDVPGPDTDYVIRFTPNAATHTLTGAWLSGDLKGSRWEWHVDAAGEGKSMVTYVVAIQNFSGIAQSLEDDQQTVTVGVNVGSVLVSTRALKRRCESPDPK